jgi:hypothetical protein
MSQASIQQQSYHEYTTSTSSPFATARHEMEYILLPFINYVMKFINLMKSLLTIIETFPAGGPSKSSFRFTIQKSERENNKRGLSHVACPYSSVPCEKVSVSVSVQLPHGQQHLSNLPPP